jgi:hypothetical protein
MPTAQLMHCVSVFVAAYLPATQFVHALLLSPAAVTPLSAPVTPLVVLAVVSQAAVFAVAAAQLALVPPAFTAQVPTSKARSCAALVWYFPAAHGVHVHESVAAFHPALLVPAVQVVAVSHAVRW